MRAWKYVLVAALVAIAIPVLATFHLTKIVEVYGGSPASPSAQYFMLQAYSSGQNQMGGHVYQIYNASGVLTEQGTIASNVANSANQMRVLFATTQAQSFFNVTADVTIPAEIIQAGGKVCFETTIDCVAWGSWSGGTTGVGTPFNVSGGGLAPGRAAKRRLDISGGATTLEAGDDTGNSATDFVEGLPAPRNNANVIGTIPPSTCGNNILEGVEQCDDHNTNNGDGCSSTCALEAGGGTPSLTIADVSTTEGNSGTKLLTFTVNLSAAAAGAVTYNIATSNGTATAGSDYVANSLVGESIPAGMTSKTFAVTINGDATVEPDENFNVTVSNVVGATVGDGAAVGTITNDDGGGGGPTLTIADVSTSEGNSGTKTLTFTVSLSASAAGAVTYDIATSNGTATAGSDYVANSLVGQSIAAGMTSKTFGVTINGDTSVESDETFNVTVSNVVGATVGDGAAVGTITNDDSGGGGPTLSIADNSAIEGSGGGYGRNLSFTISLSAPASGTVTFNFDTSDGTAFAGEDYEAKNLPGQTILAGATSKIIRVGLYGDVDPEPDETFNATLSSVSGATLGDGTAVGTIVNDDGAALALKLASLRMPKEAAAAPSQEALRVLQAVNLLCSELGAPALVALRGNGLPPLARELAAESRLQPDCARAANFVVATAPSARDGADAPALLLDTSAVREGVARVEVLESTRLFESTREGGSGRYLFDSAPLLVRVRLNDAHGGPIEMAILVLGRESQPSVARREAQAAALSSWLWSLRDREPGLAVAIAGPLAASELRGFPLGEIATPRSATRGEHLLGNAPLLDAARSLGHGESCALPRTDGLACALSELEFVP